MNWQNLLLNINFYEEDTNQGESFWPFIGFWIFIAGVMVILYGVVSLVTERRDFRIFYDASASKEDEDITLKKKKMKKYAWTIAAGVVLVVVSYFF